jgi:hypothetical protein
MFITTMQIIGVSKNGGLRILQGEEIKYDFYQRKS